jgi:restriction system protein
MVVRELFGVMAAEGATGGFVVTSGVFTQAATDFAKGRNIDLLDGPELAALLQKACASSKSVAPAALMATSHAATTFAPENPTPEAPPSCPR